MEVTLDDDQEFFRETTERFLSTECPLSTVRALADDDTGFDSSYWRQGAELGWTSFLAAEAHGGGSITEAGAVDLSIVADAFGRHVAPGPLLPANVVAAALSRAGSEGHRATVLPTLLSGQSVAAWCGWEHAFGTGSLRATASGRGHVLEGVTAPVEAGGQADWFLVTADGDGCLRQFLVAADAPGVTVEPLASLDLVRRYARIRFDQTPAGDADSVGSVVTAAADVEHQLQLALTIQTAEMVGAAERAFDLTLEWAFDRYSFGRPLASYQELKHRFADMKTWLEASHSLSSALAHEAGTGVESAPETASIAKAYCGEFLSTLAQDCIQMHGGIGLTTEHDIHLFVRRITVGRSMYGLPSQHRRRVADGRVRIVEEAAA